MYHMKITWDIDKIDSIVISAEDHEQIVGSLKKSFYCSLFNTKSDFHMEVFNLSQARKIEFIIIEG